MNQQTMTNKALSHRINNYLSNYNKVYIKQEDFINGPYIISKPGIYVLTENIILEPNIDNFCFPEVTEAPNSIGPFILGFFAGIIIQTRNVILDLNKFTIKQSDKFYLLQRFFSIIELNNTPFIPKQGPGNFGNNIIKSSNIIIKNGNIGLSSHHAIHGNGNSNIIMEDLNINDFEVAGIALNGVKNLFCNRIEISRSVGYDVKVPVNGRFSSGLYIWRLLGLFIKLKTPYYVFNFAGRQISINNAFQYINSIVMNIINKVEALGLKNPLSLEGESNIFENTSGLVDCSAIYGILINKIGVAINEFGSCDKKDSDINYSENIELRDVKIKELILNPLEVVLIQDRNGKIQKDFSGNACMLCEREWYKYPDNHYFYRYNDKRNFIIGNSYDKLLLLQIMVQEYSKKFDLKWAKGVSNIDDKIVKWVQHGFYPLCNDCVIKTCRNGDIMSHVMKGSVALRLDFARNVKINNCNINNILNVGERGLYNEYLGSYVSNEPNKKGHSGHPKSSEMDIGYSGNLSRGISCISCNDIDISNVNIKHILSKTGSCYGIDIMSGNTFINLNKIMIDEIIGTTIFNSQIPKNINYILPNWIQSSVGLNIRSNNDDFNLGVIDIGRIECCGKSNCLEIDQKSKIKGLKMSTQSKNNSSIHYLI